MLDIYLHDGARSFTVVVTGTLTGSWARELEHSWRTAMSILDGKKLVLNIAGLTVVDEEGVRLLRLISRSGAGFITGSDSTDAIACEISGRKPVLLPTPPKSLVRRWLCRFQRCCARVESAWFHLRGCGSPQMKLW